MSQDLKTSPPQGRPLDVVVNLRDVREGELRPDVYVYAFTSQGRPCDARRVSEEGRATLRVSETATKVLVVAGPEVERAPTLAELRRLGAAEKEIRFEPRSGAAQVPSLTIEAWRPIWSGWWLRRCGVHGRVEKAVGGLRLGVCGATVEVYEVDPLHVVLQRLPDAAVEALRRGTIRSADSLPVGDLTEYFPGHEGVQGPGLGLAGVLQGLPEPALAIARSGSAAQFRQALLQNLEVLRQIFCWLHPRWVTRQKVAQGTTDREGRFSVSFQQMTASLHRPDLWFRATQSVPGHGTVTIYERFPVSCHTWPNHDGASEVALTTTHPLAHTSDGNPSDENVGRGGNPPMPNIRGLSVALVDRGGPRRGYVGSVQMWRAEP